MTRAPEDVPHGGPGGPRASPPGPVAFLAAVIASSSDSIIGTDVHGAITSWNRSAEELYGWSTREAVGRPITMIVPEDRREEFRDVLAKVLGGQPVELAETVRVTREGRRVDVFMRLSPVYDEEGRLIGASGIARDITAQKRHEREVAEGRARMQVLYESITDALFVHGVGATRAERLFVEVNDVACRRLGYSREELLHMAPDDIDAPKPESSVPEVMARLNAGETVLFEQTHVSKAGVHLPVEISARLVSLGGRPAVLSLVRDITDRKQREREHDNHLVFLEGLDRVNRAMQSATDLPQMLKDVLDVLLEVFACDRAWLVYPCDPASPTWTVPMERTRPEYPGAGVLGGAIAMTPDLASLFDTALHTRGALTFGPAGDLPLPREIEEGFRTKSQILMALYPRGDAPYVFGLHQCSRSRTWTPEEATLFQEVGLRLADTLASLLARQRRKHAEDALFDAQQVFRTLVENSPDIIARYDRDCRRTYVNPAYRRVAALEERHLLAAAPIEHSPLPKDSASALQDLIGRVLATGKPEAEDIDWPKPGGDIVIYNVSAFPEFDREDRVVSVTTVSRDVTERRRLEEALLQSQKMEAVGRLAGGVAHDFNNLLTAILGYGHLLDTRLDEAGFSREEVSEIVRAGERASALTRQLLAFSRKQVLSPVVFSVNDLVSNFQKMLHRVIGEDIQFVTHLAPDAGSVRADPGQIEQVIMNLAVNARDAMSVGGTLTIETSAFDVEGLSADWDPPLAPGRHAAITVTDTGVGMDAATCARIYEPFFTTKEKGKGTGLGLAMVYGIVCQSGGAIRVSSRLGVGTTFSICLPRAPDAPARKTRRSGDTEQTFGSETILVVDDEPAVREIARRSLEKYGYRVLLASGGREALALAGELAEPLRLLVTDVVMPETSGVELAVVLKNRFPALRILFMSGYAADEPALRGGELRDSSFIAKPFTPRSLAQRVRDTLATELFDSGVRA